MRAAVITVSDSCFRGQRVDVSGPVVADLLRANAFPAQSTGALVFEPVNQVKEFIRFQLLEAHALPFGEWLRWSTGRAGWNFG